MTIKHVSALALVLSLTGCATPVTILTNPTNGQIARCGGDTSGSLAGGLIGYSIQKSSDERCVRDYESLGFKRAAQ